MSGETAVLDSLSHKRGAMVLDTRSRKILRFATFEVDVRAGELRKQGKRIKLQEQPLQVLVVLLQRAGDVVTREELRSQIWLKDTFVDFDNSLNTAINKLREALGDAADNPRFVETLPRRGYRFIAPVEYAGLATDSPAEVQVDVIPREIAGRVAVTASATRAKKIPGLTRLVFGALAVTAISASLVLYRRSTAHQVAPAVKSLAVLPLNNLSGDPTQEYFADGMTEE